MGVDDSRFLQQKNKEATNCLVDEAFAFNSSRLNFLSLETKLLLLSCRKINKVTGEAYVWAHLVDLPHLQLFTRAKMVLEARSASKKSYQKTKGTPNKKFWTFDRKMLQAGDN